MKCELNLEAWEVLSDPRAATNGPNLVPTHTNDGSDVPLPMTHHGRGLAVPAPAMKPRPAQYRSPVRRFIQESPRTVGLRESEVPFPPGLHEGLLRENGRSRATVGTAATRAPL